LEPFEGDDSLELLSLPDDSFEEDSLEPDSFDEDSFESPEFAAVPSEVFPSPELGLAA
jgi:hypothetical protein